MATTTIPSGPTFSTINWRDLVLKSWGEQWSKPEIAYEFSNRNFDDSGPVGAFYQR